MPTKKLYDNRGDRCSVLGEDKSNCLNKCNLDIQAGIENIYSLERWFVMRDLKRANAKLPAYKMLREKGIEVFTPMRWRLTMKSGKRYREEVPYMQDLLFVHSSYRVMEPLVRKISTLQYRFIRGGGYCEPMTVRDEVMNRFITAVNATETPLFYTPSELTPDMIGKRVQIVGGPLDNFIGPLLQIRGTRKKRIIVSLPTVLVAAIEISPDFIRVL